MNPVKALELHGQSVWLDFLARGFVTGGDLKAMIERDGVKGVTSNPAIFEKAIGSSDEYDGAIATLLKHDDRAVIDLYEAVAIEDIRNAADVLRPVYDATMGHDGFVSLEVSPYLALDTRATIEEGERLWRQVERPNLMVKVPATAEGLPAIRHLIGKGISVNVTLLFSQAVYEDVAQAYLDGLETLIGNGGDVAGVASVASFFVSRIDTAVDAELDKKIAALGDATEKAALEAIKGKVAIANAKLAYQSYKRLFSGARWNALASRGAKPQRLLWASTGAKNKAYRDVVYVEELIGPNTVNTVPPATLDAFRDHGAVRNSLEENIDAARRTLETLAQAGVALDAITARLVTEGVQLFVDAADKLLGAVAGTRQRLVGEALASQSISEGDFGDALEKETERWRAEGLIRRLWQGDAAVWTNGDESKWLGWLTSAAGERDKLAGYADFAAWVKAQRFTDAVVLGMGGSSLGPEVLANTFPRQAGFPQLRVLDSTDPAQVRALRKAIDLTHTLFIVSSKSGGTTEPNAMKDYFFGEVASAIGAERAGGHFVAVTDPGSSMEATAKRQNFARIFHGEPTIGGRYSVLSPFGMVPAAAAGIDLTRFLDAALTMVRACGPDVPPANNLGVQLGLLLGLAGKAGRDKVTITASRSIADFGAWAEQLIAESTGKDGKGLIPIDGESLGAPDVYGKDRVFIDLRVRGDDDAAHDANLDALAQAGHPVVRIAFASAAQIGQEFFRFELATAVAGAVLGINPFDQPDVEAAKIKTRELIAAFDKAGSLPGETALAAVGGIRLLTDARNAKVLRPADVADLASWLAEHLRRAKAGDYVALLAYLDRNATNIDALQRMRTALRDRLRVATCAEFGPRFLHSTGQAYKGGPDSGLFLQITADDAADLAIPSQKASFGIIKAAQARGDFDVLTDRGRRALRLHLSGDVANGLAAIEAALNRALGVAAN